MSRTTQLSTSAPTTAAAACSSNVPANTPSRSNTSRSVVAEQGVGPVDRRAQRLVPFHRGAAPAGEEPEPLVEAARDLGRASSTRRVPPRARSPAGSRRDADRSLPRAPRSPSTRRSRARPRCARSTNSRTASHAPDLREHRRSPRARGSERTGMTRSPRDARAPPGSSPGSARPGTPAAIPSARSAARRGGARSCRARPAAACSPQELDHDSSHRPHALAGRCTAKALATDLHHRVRIARRGQLTRTRPRRRNRGSISAATCNASRVLPDTTDPGERHQARLAQRLSRSRQLARARRTTSAAPEDSPGERIQRPQRRELPIAAPDATTWNTRSGRSPRSRSRCSPKIDELATVGQLLA